MSGILRQARVLRGIARYILDNPSNEGQKPLRVALAVAWQLYKRTVGLPLLVPLDNGLSFVADPISTNSSGVIYTRLYEPEYTLFARKHVVPGGAIVDVGAHVGLFTLQLAHLFHEGVCFEPAADNFALLARNFRLNALDRFRLVQRAVSDRTGEVDLLRTGSHSSMNRIDPSPTVATEGSERVTMTTLDEYLAAHPLGTELTFLKLDIEGHELAALRGAERTLRAARRALAIIENSERVAVAELLGSLGWSVFAITKNGRIQRDSAALERAYNLVACGPDHPLNERSQNGEPGGRGSQPKDP